MRSEAIYKGATRPAMKLGIPLAPLVVLLGGSVLLVMWGGVLISWWIALAVILVAAPVLGWMRFITARDDQRLRHLIVATRLKLRDRNRRLWLARSYGPNLYRGMREAWYA